MSAFWDDLKKNVKLWGSAAAEKAEELGKVAATKTEELTKISKVKLELHQLQRDRDKEFTKLGKFVFEATGNENVTNFAGNEQFFSHVEKAQDLISQIKDKEEKMEQIKADYESAAKEGEESKETAEDSASASAEETKA